ncbi:MAG: hypothetical protein D6704_03440 [Nitrospirae bacterium]|nr:MAG: hypothetical protein D6704_03440 [Nitrospirota bacterium]
MSEFIASIFEFISPETAFILTLFSVVAFVGTLIAIPAILIRLPENYFSEPQARSWMANHHPILRVLGLTIKNGVGLIFLLAGIAMLVLPGQGLLTILIGLSLMDFPGKQTLERKLIAQSTIFHTVNALRQKCGKPPFVHPYASQETTPHS